MRGGGLCINAVTLVPTLSEGEGGGGGGGLCINAVTLVPTLSEGGGGGGGGCALMLSHLYPL